MHQHAHKTGNRYTTSPVKIRFVEGTREWIERGSSSREDEKQREEVVRRGEGTEMAEGLNSITKVRGFPKLLFSSFNLLLLLPRPVPMFRFEKTHRFLPLFERADRATLSFTRLHGDVAFL